MIEFFILIIILIGLILFCVLTLERAMWLCIDYWSDKQYKLWKMICVAIGSCFLIAIVILCVVSEERFSAKMIKLTLILVLTAYILIGMFIIILHFIAWIGTCKIIENKLRKYLIDKDLSSDKNKILNEFMYVNQGYPKKTVNRIFKKVLSQNKKINS